MLFAPPAYFTVWVNRIKKPFTYGFTPSKVALSITTGIIAGVFPFFLVPSFLLMLVALTRRINVGIAVLFNYLAWPLQIILFVPYTRLGNSLFGGSSTDVSFDILVHSFRIDFFGALQKLSSVVIHSMGGWAVSSVPAGILLFYSLYFIAQALPAKTAPQV